MKKLFMVLPLVLLLCFTFSCQKGEEVAEEPLFDVEAETEAIKEWFQKYEANYRAGDLDGYGTFWAEDVIWLPPNAPVIKGKAAILDFARPFFEQYNILSEITLEEIKVTKSFAFARFSALEKYSPKGEAEAVEESRMKAIFIFRQEDDGRWVATHDIWSSDSPPLPTEE